MNLQRLEIYDNESSCIKERGNLSYKETKWIYYRDRIYTDILKYIGLDRKSELYNNFKANAVNVEHIHAARRCTIRFKNASKNDNKYIAKCDPSLVVEFWDMVDLAIELDKIYRKSRHNELRRKKRNENKEGRQYKKNILISKVQILKEQGLKQVEVAEQLGVHKSTVSRYWNIEL